MEGEGASNQSIIETNAQRKGRGTKKCIFRNNSKGIALQNIQVSKRGQPIDLGSKKFTSCIAVLVREIIGIKFRYWKKVLEALKKDTWNTTNVSSNQIMIRILFLIFLMHIHHVCDIFGFE